MFAWQTLSTRKRLAWAESISGKRLRNSMFFSDGSFFFFLSDRHVQRQWQTQKSYTWNRVHFGQEVAGHRVNNQTLKFRRNKLASSSPNCWPKFMTSTCRVTVSLSKRWAWGTFQFFSWKTIIRLKWDRLTMHLTNSKNHGHSHHQDHIQSSECRVSLEQLGWYWYPHKWFSQGSSSS